MQTTEERNRVYRAERRALLPHQPRWLAYAEARDLAQELLGEYVHFTDLTDVPTGIAAFGVWADTTMGRIAVIGTANPDRVSDLLLLHELAHLTADRGGQIMGHGPEWLDAYVGLVEQVGRPKVARDLALIVGEVLADALV